MWSLPGVGDVSDYVESSTFSGLKLATPFQPREIPYYLSFTSRLTSVNDHKFRLDPVYTAICDNTQFIVRDVYNVTTDLCRYPFLQYIQLLDMFYTSTPKDLMIYSLYIAHHAHSYVHLQNTFSGFLSRPLCLDLKICEWISPSTSNYKQIGSGIVQSRSARDAIRYNMI